ncbi:ATP-binding protein [Kineococcus sp. TBRC 1896]|uniref:Sensor-like histidine kinase SenX3 n=1 Tax=Kineococcus mangrovi TaxID=1660183 RepID=A0ABV4I7P6_9ACTN
MGRDGQAAGTGPGRPRQHPPTAGTSVGARLTRALGLVVALLLLVAASGAAGLLVTGSSGARETRLRTLEAANAALLLTLTDADTAVRDHQDTHQPQTLQTYRRAVQTLPAQRARVEQSLTDPLQRSLFAEQSRLTDTWLRATDPDRGAADLTGATTQARAFTDLRGASDRLDTLVRHQRHAAARTQTRVRHGALALTALTLAAALAVLAGTGARTRRALVDPLRALVEVLDAHGRGDRSAHADPAAGPAEVRSVALAVNDLARENARLLAAAERSARLHRLAGDIGRQVRDQLRAEDAVRVAATRLGQELRVGRVWVRMLHDASTPARAPEGAGQRPGLGAVAGQWAAPGLQPLAPDGGVLRAVDGADGWLRELHASGEVHAVPDTRTPRGRPAPPEGFARETGARALLLVPIGVGDAPRGLLSVACGDGPREWTVEEVELARSVAGDLSRALVLADLYRAQERLLGELRDVEAVKSDLLATVSHELRTPLTSISGYLELLRDGALGEVGEDVAAVLGILDRNTERLRSLIEDLLLLSRVESAPATEVRGASAVADLLTGALAALQPGPGRATVRCTTDPDELAGLRVPGEGEHLRRALLAVLDNAVKFSPAGSLVRVHVEHDPREVRVVVQDEGMGIPAADLAGVFTRFTRGSNAAVAQVPGTGLGLTIARDLLRLHGGGVDLDSVEGRGTTATVRLPLLTGATPAPATASGPRAGASPRPGRLEPIGSGTPAPLRTGTAPADGAR